MYMYIYIYIIYIDIYFFIYLCAHTYTPFLIQTNLRFGAGGNAELWLRLGLASLLRPGHPRTLICIWPRLKKGLNPKP